MKSGGMRKRGASTHGPNATVVSDHSLERLSDIGIDIDINHLRLAIVSELCFCFF